MFFLFQCIQGTANFPYQILLVSFHLQYRNAPCYVKPVKYVVAFFSARVAPFKLSFVSDADEVIPAGAATGASDTNEASTGAAALLGVAQPGIPGTLGFSLGFTQTPCA